MTTHAIDIGKLKALASMSADDLGETEEDVKIHFIVPRYWPTIRRLYADQAPKGRKRQAKRKRK